MNFKNEIYDCLEYKPYIEGESVLVRRDELQDFLTLQPPIRDSGKSYLSPHGLKYMYENSNRYEKLRKLSPNQFAELYDANLKTGKSFDELVDELE